MSSDFQVFISDNFHYMDEGESYLQDSYPTCEAAIQACKKIVDDFLRSTYKPGMTGTELWELYTAFGDDAFIMSPPGTRCPFSAWDYARDQCTRLSTS
jgi:hypothetical protein